MMTMELHSTLRQLIDARLDTIERALMTQGTPRGDRRQILSAIEDQILEMLGQVAGDEPSREDVLSILAKLDPPEAYLDLGVERPSSFTAIPVARQTPAPMSYEHNIQSEFNTLAIVAFALTCFAGIGSFTWWFMAYYGFIPLAILTLAASVCGTTAMCQFIKNRQKQRGLWMAVTASSCAPAIAFLSVATLFILDM